MVVLHVAEQSYPQDQEPITPFISRVRALYDTHGVSNIPKG